MFGRICKHDFLFLLVGILAGSDGVQLLMNYYRLPKQEFYKVCYKVEFTPVPTYVISYDLTLMPNDFTCQEESDTPLNGLIVVLYVLNMSSILAELNLPYSTRYITTSQQEKIWTVSFNPEGTKTPILMIHGFGAGLGMWALNVEELSKDRPMHTFDMLGFGRSSRPTFDEDPEIVEETFVNSIEDTRKELGIEKFILIGHSFGGYLAYAYTIKHPEQVKSLILADPWGFSEKPADWDKTVSIPRWVRIAATILKPFNPLSGIRIAGPLGILQLQYQKCLYH